MGYEKPELNDYGTVQELTAQFGSEQVDVPEGTPSGVVGGVVGNVS